MSEAFIPWIGDLAAQAVSILDAGCGPNAGYWWTRKTPDAELAAVDLLFTPPEMPPGAHFYQMDIAEFLKLPEYRSHFDLVAADHLLEHVPDPAEVLRGFHDVLQPTGMLHVGIPDASNFTDRFYHLVHPDGGGHISGLTFSSLAAMADAAGFEILRYRPWPDSWTWFKELFDPRAQGLKCVAQEDIDYIADVFLRELTPEKGYYYGWEVVFVKGKDQ